MKGYVALLQSLAATCFQFMLSTMLEPDTPADQVSELTLQNDTSSHGVSAAASIIAACCPCALGTAASLHSCRLVYWSPRSAKPLAHSSSG